MTLPLEPGSPTTVLPSICPECGTQVGGRPFCPRDGTLVGGQPFVIGERYRIEERLGHGGTALVFGARHLILGRPVAVKILRPEIAANTTEAQRFLRQARLASQLSHDNIVGIVDFGHDERIDVMYLVMDRLAGPTLADIIKKEAPMRWQRVASTLLQLCRALSAAHTAGVVHRDLNPRNVIAVASSGREDVAKLCDFGLSRETSGDGRVTVTGTMIGTPAYMAPEQIRGDVVQDGRVDLYALGVTAYEMLTNAFPYDGGSPVSMIANKLTLPPAPMRSRFPGLQLPERFETLIQRCLESDPAARPASAEEVERELVSILAISGNTIGTGGGPMAVDLVGQTLGSYQVTKLLGTGGMGSVYLGEHPLIGTKVAIKVLLPEVCHFPGVFERFVQEARATSEIGDAHIPRFFDFGRLPDGRPYAVMEYLEGETLGAHLIARGPLPVADVVSIGLQVAEALTRAHKANIVHRDIKPDNIFLVQKTAGAVADLSAVKVLDFGIAKMVGATTSTVKTTMGFIVGTPQYSAPEQLLGRDVGPAADVYALGATLFEMLTGRLPFEGDAADIMAAKVKLEAPRASDFRATLPREIVDDLARMLSYEPNDRPASMGEVLEVLGRWSSARPSSAERVPSLKPAARDEATRTPVLSLREAGVRSTPMVFGLAGGALALVVVGVVAWAWPTTHAEAPARAGSAPEIAPAASPPATVLEAQTSPVRSPPPVAQPTAAVVAPAPARMVEGAPVAASATRRSDEQARPQTTADAATKVRGAGAPRPNPARGVERPRPAPATRPPAPTRPSGDLILADPFAR